MVARDGARRVCARPTPAVMGSTPDDIAITTSTSEGMARVLAGLDLRAGDEVLTSTTEHPGLIGPLVGGCAAAAFDVRAVPLAEIADAVSPEDEARRLLARRLDQRRAARAGRAGELDIPVLLDGAQGAGAVALDAAGARLRVLRRRRPEVAVRAGRHRLPLRRPAVARAAGTRSPRATCNLEDPAAGLDAVPKTTAGAHDTFTLSAEALLAALAAHDVLASFGWDQRLRAREHARGAARRTARRGGLHRRAARRDDARQLGDGRQQRRGPAAAGRAGGRRPPPARHAIRAGVGRGLERRIRPRPTARRAVGGSAEAERLQARRRAVDADLDRAPRALERPGAAGDLDDVDRLGLIALPVALIVPWWNVNV